MNPLLMERLTQVMNLTLLALSAVGAGVIAIGKISGRRLRSCYVAFDSRTSRDSVNLGESIYDEPQCSDDLGLWGLSLKLNDKD